MNPVPRQMHPERTADEAVVRWVVNSPALEASPVGRRRVPSTGPIAELAAAGDIVEVVVSGGDVVLRAVDARRWAPIAEAVRQALRLELDELDRTGSSWLTVDVDDQPTVDPTDVQRVVDQAAGALMAQHGGRIEVLSIRQGTAHLRAHGACHGCSGSASTVLGTIAPAIRHAFPQIVTIDLSDSGCVADTPTSISVDRPRRRWLTRSSGCH